MTKKRLVISSDDETFLINLKKLIKENNETVKYSAFIDDDNGLIERLKNQFPDKFGCKCGDSCKCCDEPDLGGYDKHYSGGDKASLDYLKNMFGMK